LRKAVKSKQLKTGFQSAGSHSILLLIKNAKHFSIRSSYAVRNKPIYTAGIQVYENLIE
jgi:hypothetical protein